MDGIPCVIGIGIVCEQGGQQGRLWMKKKSQSVAGKTWKALVKHDGFHGDGFLMIADTLDRV
jgi:hypothetical protein